MTEDKTNQETSPQGITYNYKLIKGGDNNTYVSVEPLMNDIQVSVDRMMEMDISSLSPENKQIFDLKLLGLKTVYEFLGALRTEQTLREASKELKGSVELNAQSTYSVMTDKVIH
jgi:hypothetical protein